MRSLLVAALIFLAACPLQAQEPVGPAKADKDDGKSIAPFEGIDVGGVADGAYLPLALGRDRTGWGLRARLSMGWDSNIFKEERDDEEALFSDLAADAYFGANLGKVAAGVRGLLAGRLYFGEPDADEYDMKLGGFFKVPYGDGGLGMGISADILYQQLQTYEITSALTRQDDLRAGGTIGRAWMGYAFSRFAFEVGVHGQSDNFSEEATNPSYDNWEVGVDIGLYMDLYAIQLRPFVDFSYEWFRDQLDRDDFGAVVTDEDALALLKLYYGLDFAVDLAVFEAQGRVYAKRQDDSNAGFDRYWQYGLDAAADINVIGILRFTVGAQVWYREYEDRVDVDPSTGATSTTIERYGRFWGEGSFSIVGILHVGLRYVYERRDSDIPDGGFDANEITIFVEVDF